MALKEGKMKNLDSDLCACAINTILTQHKSGTKIVEPLSSEAINQKGIFLGAICIPLLDQNLGLKMGGHKTELKCPFSQQTKVWKLSGYSKSSKIGEGEVSVPSFSPTNLF